MNLGAVVGALVYLLIRWDHSVYFYRYNLVHVAFAVPLGVFLVTLSGIFWKRDDYWRGWRENAGIGLALAILVIFPIGLFLVQWTSTKIQSKESLSGTVEEKGVFRERGRFRNYRGLLVGVRGEDGVLRRFDLSSHGEAYARCSRGAAISITHYPWIRDAFLEVRIEPSPPGG